MAEFGYRGVLFDMDGVILDSMDHHAATWIEVLGQEGISVTREFILAHEGALAPQVIAGHVETALGRSLTQDELGDWMIAMFERQLALYLSTQHHHVRPYGHSAPVLTALASAGVPAALVTSSSRDMVEACLGPDLAGSFKAIITRDDVDRYKPHPMPYLAGAAALGLDPGECLAVENAPAGVASATAAGAACYALSTTLTPADLAQSRGVFNDLVSLMRHLGLRVE